ncbi:hypothetical protein GIB67_018701, partial [Kingdonia uniflora]
MSLLPVIHIILYSGFTFNLISRMHQIDVMRSYIVQVNIVAWDAQVKGTYRQTQRFQKMDGKDTSQKMDK